MLISLSFTVPVTSGQYAPEELYLNVDNDKRSMPDLVSELTAHIEQLPAGSQLEVDLLRPGKEPGQSASWMTATKVYTLAGLQAALGLSQWRGVRLRAKSGGTAGTLIAHAAWF